VNWKNVLLLVTINIKSYRLIRGSQFRRFREHRLMVYALYVGACFIGGLVGWVIGNFYAGVSDLTLRGLLYQGATQLFISLPTLALLYSLIFTQMSQVQRMGAKVTIQPLYWFPITWKEHTLASIIASILGAPLTITIFVGSSIFAASIFIGLVPLAALTILALLASVILASVTTEILKSVQTKLGGVVTKAAGRAAVWVRLFGTLLFFLVFYLIYFSLYYAVTPIGLVQSIADVQLALWFIPYVWLGMILFTFVSSLWLEMLVLSIASLIFIYALFMAAVRVNVRFGLYEIPSIRISSGAYIPKAGLLARLGFSSLEAAIIKKDFRSVTRRRELMYIFIFPIVMIIAPLLSSMRTAGGTQLPAAFSSFMFAYLTLLPGALIAVTLGTLIIGSEGESVWFLYSSPISSKSLVRAKYSFVALFSLVVAFICSTVSGILTGPSPRIIIIGLIEALFLVFSLAMVSLTFGIKGADFRELPPRPRMIRPVWGLINMVVCVAIGLAIIAPLIPVGLRLMFPSIDLAPSLFSGLPEYYVYVSLLASGIIAVVVTWVFYRMAVNSAEGLLLKAVGVED